MNFFKYTYNGIEYDFRMSNKAKVAIEEEETKMLEKVAQNQNLVESLALLENAEKENLSEEEKYKLSIKVAPALQMVQKLDSVIEPIKLGYILLHSLSKYSSLTKEEYEAMIEDMEENLGFQKVQETFTDIHDKVFSLLGAMTEKQAKKTKTKKKMS